MSNFEKQTTAAGNAIRPAAVAMTKCPPLFDRDTQAHVRVGFARRRRKPAISPRSSATTVASTRATLTGYFRALIFSRRQTLTPPISQPTPHAACDPGCATKRRRIYRDRLTQRQIRNLLIAALFHDFDHPGHPHPGADDPDGINIGRSIAALRRHIAPEDRPFLPGIEALIEATHYPYVVAGEQFDLSGQIIRDCRTSRNR